MVAEQFAQLHVYALCLYQLQMLVPQLDRNKEAVKIIKETDKM